LVFDAVTGDHFLPIHRQRNVYIGVLSKHESPLMPPTGYG